MEKSFLMRLKQESEKAGLKLSIQKKKIMTYSPITSQQIDGGESGNSDRFYFLGLQNHYKQWLHEIKDTFSLEEKLWQT